MPIKIWIAALLLSFILFVVLLLLSIPSIFLVLIILILGIGSAVLTKIFVSDSSNDQSVLECFLFVFVSSLFVYLIGLLVDGELSIVLPLMLIYGFGLFIFNSPRSFLLYSLLAVVSLIIQMFWVGQELSINLISVWGYVAIFFALTLFLFLYNHDFKVKNKAFNLLNTELNRYQHKQSTSEEDEYAIRTNSNLEIISFSQSAQKTLFSYQTNVVGKKLFTVLYIKDEQGVLIGNNNQLMRDLVDKQEQITMEKMTLLLPNTAKQYSCVLAVHPIITMDGVVEQIEFGLKVPELKIVSVMKTSPLESQRMAFASMLVMLRAQLEVGNVADGLFVSELAGRAYQSLILAEDLNGEIVPNISVTDSAQALRTIVVQEKKMAHYFKSDFSLDIVKQHNKAEEPLFPETVSPEVRELTGPYYSIQTDNHFFDRLISLVLYCYMSVVAFEKDKTISIHVNSDQSKVLFVFSAVTGLRAQESLKKLFAKEAEVLKAGVIPYTLGIEGVLIQRILVLLKANLSFEIGSTSKVILSFGRYVSKNNKISF